MGEQLLDSIRQYWADLRTLTQSLPQAEEIELVLQAQNGDIQARNRLIESCLGYVDYIAQVTWAHSQAMGDYLACDYLDLVQVGSSALVEHFDLAMSRSSQPTTGYLRRLARGKILDFCVCRSAIISIPGRQYRFARPFVESLDAKPYLESPWKELADILTDVEASLEVEHLRNLRMLYNPIYQAVEALPEREKAVIINHFGLYDQPAFQLVDLGRKPVIYSLYRRAIIRLRRLLTK